MKTILILMIVSSLSFGGSLFKAENDEETHIVIGTMTGFWANALSKKHGATNIQAMLIGVGTSIAVGYAASGGNTDMASDAIGGVIGSTISITIYEW